MGDGGAGVTGSVGGRGGSLQTQRVGMKEESVEVRAWVEAPARGVEGVREVQLMKGWEGRTGRGGG